jgi:excisionase family DNA binding protein
MQIIGEQVTVTEKWLSVEEIADHLGISRETVYRWLENGKIPSHRIGKLWRFKTSEVDQWITAGGAEEAPTSKSKTVKPVRKRI